MLPPVLRVAAGGAVALRLSPGTPQRNASSGEVAGGPRDTFGFVGVCQLFDVCPLKACRRKEKGLKTQSRHTVSAAVCR